MQYVQLNNPIFYINSLDVLIIYWAKLFFEAQNTAANRASNSEFGTLDSCVKWKKMLSLGKIHIQS